MVSNRKKIWRKQWLFETHHFENLRWKIDIIEILLCISFLKTNTYVYKCILVYQFECINNILNLKTFLNKISISTSYSFSTILYKLENRILFYLCKKITCIIWNIILIKSYTEEKHYMLILDQKINSTIAKMIPNLHWELNFLYLLAGLQFTAWDIIQVIILFLHVEMPVLY